MGTIPGVANGGDLADTAIRALEGGALSYNGNPSKSTLIIHSVQRVSIYIRLNFIIEFWRFHWCKQMLAIKFPI